MDLSAGAYAPEIGSMRHAARRPRTLMGEALNTGRHAEETMRLPLRKRPMEFVKAKSVYDPNEELRKQLEEVRLEADNSVFLTDVKVPESGSESEEPEPELEPAKIESEPEKIELQESNEPENPEEEEEPEEPAVETASEPPVETESESDGFVIDEEGEAIAPVPKLSAAMLGHRAEPVDSALEHDPVLTIGKVQLQTATDENGDMTTDLLTVESLNRIARPGFVNEQELASDSDSYDGDSDANGYNDYISQIMQQMRDDSDYEGSDYESDTNFDIMAESSDESDQASDQEVSEDEPSEPEYGFVEEDYTFDISRISISNVRLGLKNQYYTTCMDLTGSPDDPAWIDEDDIQEYALQNGVKEHRLNSFFKFLCKGLVDEDEFVQPNYSDVYISETSEEEIEEDDENLQELLAFSTQQKRPNNNDIDFDGNKSIRTKGKGKKKQLDLDHLQMDIDLRESLQEQYLSQRESKKARKQRKEDAKLEDGIAKHDLFVKYPYTLHIRDIRDEMESFLHNPNRDRVRFPPLDPHGNKVVGKMADCYNFKSKRVGGTGLKSHMEVVKTKRTFQHLPRYDQIGNILRQRPIFHRIDQKRPKDEIVELDGNKKKDKSRGRNKETSGAHVKEGDIVGEKAPEIDINNIGRQLLMKMGWSKGEGLGVHGNKGISEPVLAKVKNSKLGLR